MGRRESPQVESVWRLLTLQFKECQHSYHLLKAFFSSQVLAPDCVEIWLEVPFTVKDMSNFLLQTKWLLTLSHCNPTHEYMSGATL